MLILVVPVPKSMPCLELAQPSRMAVRHSQLTWRLFIAGNCDSSLSLLFACYLPVRTRQSLVVTYSAVFVRLEQAFKFDPASAAALSAEVRGHVCKEGDASYHPPLLVDAGGCLSHYVRRMWAMVEVSALPPDS